MILDVPFKVHGLPVEDDEDYEEQKSMAGIGINSSEDSIGRLRMTEFLYSADLDDEANPFREYY